MACERLNRNVQVLGRSYVRVDDLVLKSYIEIVSRFLWALNRLKQMSVEFLVPAKLLTVKSRLELTKLTPDFQH
jgi:hypothetical protein